LSHQHARRARATVGIAAAAAISTVLSATPAFASPTNQGPSSSATPYLVPTAPNVQTLSLVTTPDRVPLKGSTSGQTFEFEGTPDGIGAFDNGDGTYTVLVNHEFTPTVGATRSHGSAGAFVSRLVVNKATNAVVSGEDLIKQVFLGVGATAGTTAFNRFCSADLPALTAFSAGTLGTTNRIFMNGEEAGAEGRAFGHVATGPDAGKSYELPYLGKFSWENSVANPGTGTTTAVAGTDDSSTNGQVYVYIGAKTGTGNDIQRAGLTNGSLYGIKVTGVTQEDRTNGLSTSSPTFSGAFTLASLGDVSAKNGATLDSDSVTAGVTSFLRPEDFTWDADNPSVGYFQTTDRYDQVKDGTGPQVGRSRLWKIAFSDINNLPAGGTITALLDGTESQNMLDNLASSRGGKLLLLEDVGNQAHNGKMFSYDVASDTLTQVAKHDPARFGDLGQPATAPFNQDEETSGVIDVSDIYGGAPGSYYLFDDQAHYPIAGAAVEGGQLLLMHLGADVFGTPGANVPEVPFAVALPLVGFVAAGGAYLIRRRRNGGTELA